MTGGRTTIARYSRMTERALRRKGSGLAFRSDDGQKQAGRPGFVPVRRSPAMTGMSLIRSLGTAGSQCAYAGQIEGISEQKICVLYLYKFS